MLTRRLQVLIDEDRWQRLEQASRQSGASVGEVVRRALDDALPPSGPDVAGAAQRLLAAAPPDGPEPEWSHVKRTLADERA